MITQGESLSNFTFKTRALPTLVNGKVHDMFGQPLANIEVSLPALERTTTTDKEGRYSFGYAEAPSQNIPGGQYQIEINAQSKQPDYGNDYQRITLSEGRPNKLNTIRLQALNPSIPAEYIEGGQSYSLSKGNLTLDLRNASLIFPNQRSGGGMQTQILPIDQISVPTEGIPQPLWLFANQPRGIEIQGDFSVDMRILSQGSPFDYLNGVDYVVIVGFNPQRFALVPVGVGKVENNRVYSQGPLQTTSLDFIGFVPAPYSIQNTLKAIAEGEQPLIEIQRLFDQTLLEFNNP